MPSRDRVYKKRVFQKKVLVLIPEKNLIYSQVYYPTISNYAFPGEQSKPLVLSSASVFNCSCCFDFSYPQSSAQVSLNCATLGVQTNRQKESWEIYFRLTQKDSMILRGHLQIKNSILNVFRKSKSQPPLDSLSPLPSLLNVHFWPKWRSIFSQRSIAVVYSHQNSVLSVDRTFWNCNITSLIHIACTISSTITMIFF